MKITAPDLKKFGVVDRLVPEPLGGAHRDHKAAAAALQEAPAGGGDQAPHAGDLQNQVLWQRHPRPWGESEA